MEWNGMENGMHLVYHNVLIMWQHPLIGIKRGKVITFLTTILHVQPKPIFDLQSVSEAFQL